MERIGFTLRRCAATFIDCGLILAYAGALAGLMLAVGPDGSLSKPAAYALAFVTLTGPVVLAMSVIEARHGASPGKRAMGLRVVAGADRPSVGASLVRNGLKFLPWEIAHIGIWAIPGQPFVDPPGPANAALWGLSYGLLGIQLVLVFIWRAGVHDWTAGLRVIRA